MKEKKQRKKRGGTIKHNPNAFHTQPHSIDFNTLSLFNVHKRTKLIAFMDWYALERRAPMKRATHAPSSWPGPGAPIYFSDRPCAYTFAK